MRRRVASHLAPQPGAYPPAVASSHMVHVSAQLPLDDKGRPAGDVAAQLSRAVENVRLHLQAAGLPLDAVAALTIYVAAAGDETTATTGLDARVMTAVDAALTAAFADPLPACSVIGVAALPLRARVSVAAVAVRY